MVRTGWWTRAVLAATLAAGTACFDTTTPVGGLARLAIVPVFAGSGTLDGRDATPTDVDSFVLIITNPPRTRPDTIVRRLAPGTDTLRFELEVELNEANDSVQIVFEGYNSLSGMRLYAGQQIVAVAANVAIPARPIAVSYVGPGQNVASLMVSPTAAGLRRGETVQLVYDGLDGGGAVLPDDSVPVRYATSDRAVATVTAAGLVEARGLGTARIFVTALASSAIEDTSVITVSDQPPPSIGLAPGSVAFSDTLGTADPAAQTVAVTNAGGGTLSGLAVGAIQYTSGSGWLTAQLNATMAPAMVTLTVSKGALAPGTYAASVPVTAAGVANSPQTILVSFTITALQTPATVTITPGFAVLQPGGGTTLSVAARDAQGGNFPTTGVIWASRTPGVATVSAAGAVTAVAGGQTVVVADLGGVADSIIVVVAGSGVALAGAIGDARSFDRVRPGDTVRVLVAVDLRGVAPERLGSYNAQLDWTPAALVYVRTDPVAGGFTAPTLNAAGAGGGQLRFGAADPNGHAGPQVALVQVVFTAGAAGSGTSLALSLTDLSASGTFANLLPNALLFTGHVRVQ